MSLEISLKPNEKIIFKDDLKNEDYPYPITFAVSNLALFVTKEKHFAKQSWYLERIPISDVKQVSLIKETKFYIYTLSVLVFLFGLVLIYFMIIPNLTMDENAVRSFLPFTIAAIGIAMPFLTKKRRVIIVKTKNGIYKWKPQLLTESNLNIWFAKTLVGKFQKTRILQLQENFTTACESVGVRVLKD
jgi:hypothetical protein